MKNSHRSIVTVFVVALVAGAADSARAQCVPCSRHPVTSEPGTGASTAPHCPWRFEDCTWDLVQPDVADAVGTGSSTGGQAFAEADVVVTPDAAIQGRLDAWTTSDVVAAFDEDAGYAEFVFYDTIPTCVCNGVGAHGNLDFKVRLSMDLSAGIGLSTHQTAQAIAHWITSPNVAEVEGELNATQTVGIGTTGSWSVSAGSNLINFGIGGGSQQFALNPATVDVWVHDSDDGSAPGGRIALTGFGYGKLETHVGQPASNPPLSSSSVHARIHHYLATWRLVGHCSTCMTRATARKVITY